MPAIQKDIKNANLHCTGKNQSSRVILKYVKNKTTKLVN